MSKVFHGVNTDRFKYKDNKRENISGNLPATLSLARRAGQRKSAAKQLRRNKP